MNEMFTTHHQQQQQPKNISNKRQTGRTSSFSFCCVGYRNDYTQNLCYVMLFLSFFLFCLSDKMEIIYFFAKSHAEFPRQVTPSTIIKCKLRS